MKKKFIKKKEIPASAYLPPEIASQQNSLDSYSQQQFVAQPTNENMLPQNKFLKHNFSEPNLFGSNQQLSIINSVPNQIMIRSSFSDQNFPTNNHQLPMIYQQSTIIGNDGGNCSITNQNFLNGCQNQMIVKSNSNTITCVNNEFNPIEESYNEYEVSDHERTPGRLCVKRSPIDKISRSHSLISDDRIIDIEYDTDSGWLTKNVRPNNLMIRKSSKTDESCSDREIGKMNPKMNPKINPKLKKRNFGSDRRLNKSLEQDRDDDSSEREFKISKNNFNKILNDQKSYDRVPSNQRLDSFSEKSFRRKNISKNRSRKSISKMYSSSDSLSDVDYVSKTITVRKYREEKAIGYENDLFDVPFTRGRNSSFHGRPNKLRLDKRRTSSLEALNSFVAKNQNRSSVSINDTPEYFEYDKSPLTPPKIKHNAPASSTANASNFSTSKNDVASPKSKPNKSTTKSSRKSSKKSSSEYDVSDRRRPTGNGGNTRESFRDRDQLSDRDQRDSRGSSFNRSLSNAEGTPEDKIGESLVILVKFDGF